MHMYYSEGFPARLHIWQDPAVKALSQRVYKWLRNRWGCVMRFVHACGIYSHVRTRISHRQERLICMKYWQSVLSIVFGGNVGEFSNLEQCVTSLVYAACVWIACTNSSVWVVTWGLTVCIHVRHCMLRSRRVVTIRAVCTACSDAYWRAVFHSHSSRSG